MDGAWLAALVLLFPDSRKTEDGELLVRLLACAAVGGEAGEGLAGQWGPVLHQVGSQRYGTVHKFTVNRTFCACQLYVASVNEAKCLCR